MDKPKIADKSSGVFAISVTRMIKKYKIYCCSTNFIKIWQTKEALNSTASIVDTISFIRHIVL